jgi:hypothetical protein
MEINIVYYTYINPNADFKTIIKEQLIDIINSNISVNAKLFIVISCEFEKFKYYIKKLINNTLSNTNICYNLDIESENLFEYYGIKKIHDLAIKEPDKYYLYIHGKGMCNNYGDNNSRINTNLLLTQTHLNNWQKVLNIFKKDKNVDIVGMFPSPFYFVWFNFWWASGKYLITCECPRISTNRYYYEGWLNSGGNNNKIYNLIENNYNTYTSEEAGKLLHKLIENSNI